MAAQETGASDKSEVIYRHAGAVQVTHWINAVLLVLLMSGLQIFNAHRPKRKDPRRRGSFQIFCRQAASALFAEPVMLFVGLLPRLFIRLAGLLLGLGHALVVACVVASLGRSGRYGHTGAGKDHGRGRGQKHFLKHKVTPVSD